MCETLVDFNCSFNLLQQLPELNLCKDTLQIVSCNGNNIKIQFTDEQVELFFLEN